MQGSCNKLVVPKAAELLPHKDVIRMGADSMQPLLAKMSTRWE